MGYYINEINGKPIGRSFTSKCASLIQAGAIETDVKFKSDLVCVVDNGFFAAAGYCYNESEFDAFNTPDGREKKWFVLKDAKEYVD